MVEKHRLTVRLDSDCYERVKYWSNKKGIDINTYVVEAIEEKIKRENKDYELPTLEIMRLKELTEKIEYLISTTRGLEQITTAGFQSLLMLTRGDNYLLDED